MKNRRGTHRNKRKDYFETHMNDTGTHNPCYSTTLTSMATVFVPSLTSFSNLTYENTTKCQYCVHMIRSSEGSEVNATRVFSADIKKSCKALNKHRTVRTEITDTRDECTSPGVPIPHKCVSINVHTCLRFAFI